MVNIRKFAAAIAVILVLTGCVQKTADSSHRRSETLFAMDTVIDITVYGGENTEKAVSAAIENITRYERLFSVTDGDSDIFKANNAQGGAVVVDWQTAELVEKALDLCGVTGGALDISVYPIIRAWGFTEPEKRVPEPAELEDMLPRVGYEKIFADVKNREITVLEDMQIDLGAVAKGYIGDRMLESINNSGIGAAIISLGGNVQTLGAKPDGEPWKIAVRDPLEPSEYLAVIKAGEGAVITSGGYERFFEKDGNIYHHIIDPKTGYPARNGLISVTVAGTGGTNCGFYCDGLSTALFVMGRDAALDFWRGTEGSIGGTAFELILVTDGGEVVITPGLYDNLEFYAEEKYTVTIAEPK